VKSRKKALELITFDFPVGIKAKPNGGIEFIMLHQHVIRIGSATK
jgi:hypothetical protein